MKKNILANLTGKFWSILSNFLFIPVYISFLGFESFSIISFTLVITGILATIEGGITSPLSREFALSENSKKDKARILKTLESTLFIFIGFSILTIFLASKLIAENWLNQSSFSSAQISFFLKIFSFETGFQLLFRFYMGGLLGLERQIKANIFQIAWGVFRNGLVIFGIWLVPTLEMFFIWQTASTFIFAILIGISLKKELKGYYFLDFQFKIEKSILKKISKFAAGMFLISIVTGLNTQIDKLVISKLLPIEDLGHYTLAVSLSMMIIVLVSPISTALLPRFTSLYSLDNKENALILFKKINLFVIIISFTLMVNIGFFAKELIWIWTGKIELAERAFIYLPVIAVSFSMLALQIIPYTIAIANGYTKINNILGISSLFFTLPGYWLATSHYGAIGAAYVFCITQTITTIVYLYLINKKFLKITNPLKLLYVKQMLLPLLVSFSIAFLFSYIQPWELKNRLLSFGWVGLSVCTTFVIGLFTQLSMKELKKIRFEKT